MKSLVYTTVKLNVKKTESVPTCITHVPITFGAFASTKNNADTDMLTRTKGLALMKKVEPCAQIHTRTKPITIPLIITTQANKHD